MNTTNESTVYLEILQLQLEAGAFDDVSTVNSETLKEYALAGGDKIEQLSGMRQYVLKITAKHDASVIEDAIWCVCNLFKPLLGYANRQHCIGVFLKCLTAALETTDISVHKQYSINHMHESLTVKFSDQSFAHTESQAILEHAGGALKKVIPFEGMPRVVLGISSKAWMSLPIFNNQSPAEETATFFDPEIFKRGFMSGLWTGLTPKLNTWALIMSAALNDDLLITENKAKWYWDSHPKILKVIDKDSKSSIRPQARHLYIDKATWQRLLMLLHAEERLDDSKTKNCAKTWRYIGALRHPDFFAPDACPKYGTPTPCEFQLFVLSKKKIKSLSELSQPQDEIYVYIRQVDIDVAHPMHNNQAKWQAYFEDLKFRQTMLRGENKSFVEGRPLTVSNNTKKSEVQHNLAATQESAA